MKKNFFPKNSYLYLAVFIADIGAILISLQLTWSSPILEKLMHSDDNPLGRVVTSTEQGILGALPTFGAIFGTLLSSYIARIYGRKPSIIFEGLPSIISFLLLIFASNIWVIYLGRLISGLTVGSVFSINTMYTSEVALSSNRGFLGSVLFCYVSIGNIFGLVLGTSVSYRIFHIVCLEISILFTVLAVVFVPESPYYLVTKNYAAAERSLIKLRGQSDVVEELNAMKNFVGKNENATWSEMVADKCSRKGLIIGCSLLIFQQFSGAGVLASFAQKIFDGNKSITNAPILLSIVGLFLCPLAPLITDTAGRKKLLLISHAGVSLSLFLTGLYFFLTEKGVDLIFWFPLATLILNNVFLSIGINALGWVIIGEIIPLKSKEVSVLICNIVSNLLSSIILLIFPNMVDYLGMGLTFWCYTVLTIIGFFYVKFYIFETKGKSLEEIQEILKNF